MQLRAFVNKWAGHKVASIVYVNAAALQLNSLLREAAYLGVLC